MQQEQLPSAEEVSRTLADILSGPEFESFESGLLASVLGRLWTRFWEWIAGIFPDIPAPESELLTVLIVVIACTVVSLLVLRLLPDSHRRSTRRDPDAMPDQLRSAGDWLRVARERAHARQYRRAATALYQGLVLTLERKGAVVFHPSKTPGEYALEAAGGGAIDEREKADATTFIRSFQKLAFGHQAPTRSGYHGLEKLAERTGCTPESVRE